MNPSLAKAAYFILIDADKEQLENLNCIDHRLKRLVENLEKAKILNNVNSLIVIIEDFSKKSDFQKLDFDDIRTKIDFLVSVSLLNSSLVKKISEIKISSNCGNDNTKKKLDIEIGLEEYKGNFKINRIIRKNLATLIALVVYIQDKDGVQYEEDFTNAFIEEVKNIVPKSDVSESLTKSEIKQNQIIKTQYDGTYLPSQSPVSTKKSLVLVFGLDYFDAIDHINENKVIEIDDFDWLKKAEWFKFDHNYQHIIPNDSDGNVCILQINLDSDETDAVTSRIQLRRLLKKIQEKPVKPIQIQSKSGERFQLANFQGFLQ